MSDNHPSSSDGHFFKGLFFGLIIGVGVTYFLRTKEGQRVKKELLGTGQELFEEVSEKVIEFLEEEPTP